MKIRSITAFIHPGSPLDEQRVKQAGELIAVARLAIEAAGYEVQTARLATVPFSQWIPSLQKDVLVEFACRLEGLAQDAGFDYVSLGPALPEVLQSYTHIPDVIAATQNTFLCGHLTLFGQGVSLPAVRACAQVIQQSAGLSPDGFANLRFAALANVKPGAPFFPAAYHHGDELTFALATESADLAVQAFSGAASLESACQSLVQQVEGHAGRLEKAAMGVVQQTGAVFGGLDFTLAPFPTQAQSFGAAMECLGLPGVGLHGSLAAAAILADALDEALYPRAGFNGLMLPVLEDAVLAQRAAGGLLSVKDLLLYSAVCGTGLDTIPLPGDTTAEQISALLLDVAALSQRLGKPLTARLMPIPGKQAGDATDYDFAYFANSRVLALEAQPLSRLFAGAETFDLHPRPLH